MKSNKMKTILEATEWEEDHSRSTMGTSNFSKPDDRYRKEVRTIRINEKEFTFDPKDRIFGLKDEIEK